MQGHGACEAEGPWRVKAGLLQQHLHGCGAVWLWPQLGQVQNIASQMLLIAGVAASFSLRCEQRTD